MSLNDRSRSSTNLICTKTICRQANTSLQYCGHQFLFASRSARDSLPFSLCTAVSDEMGRWHIRLPTVLTIFTPPPISVIGRIIPAHISSILYPPHAHGRLQLQFHMPQCISHSSNFLLFKCEFMSHVNE